jgi:hypothetical protein
MYLQETVSGCTAYSSTIDVNVVACATSILDGTSSIKTLNIYPNPSKDILTVSCDLPTPTDVKLVISSSLGEMLFTKVYSGQSVTFNEQLSIQELKPGSYIVQLMTGSDIRASQLIKY